MPTINRQTPTRTIPTKNGTGGGFLASAIDVADLQNDWIKMVIYGQNRVGKTYLACQFPKPLLLISFEPAKSGGAMTVKKFPGTKLIRVLARPDKEWPNSPIGLEGTKALADELRKSNPFKTIVIDSATSVQDIILQGLLALDHVPVQLGWGTVSSDQYRERSEQTKEVLRLFTDLPCHTVITAKEKDHNPPKEEKVSKSGRVSPDMRPKFLRGMQLESFFAADVGGSTVSWMNDTCDYIGRLYFDKEVRQSVSEIPITIGPDKGKTRKVVQEHETGRHIRCLRTIYHPNFAAGFRAADPKVVPECIPEPTFEKIYQIIQGIPLKE